MYIHETKHSRMYMFAHVHKMCIPTKSNAGIHVKRMLKPFPMEHENKNNAKQMSKLQSE